MSLPASIRRMFRRKPSASVPVATRTQAPGPGWLPILSGDALLQRWAGPVKEIESLVGVTPDVFAVYYITLLRAVAEFVQELPASEVDHHAGRGGLLTHLLEVCVIALRYRREKVLPPEKDPEEVAAHADAWTYAVFTAALLHDIGKPVVDQNVDVRREDGSAQRWDPWAGPMATNGSQWYRMSFVRNRGYPLHERITPMIAAQLVPQAGLTWIAAEPQRLSAWLATLNGDGESGHVIHQIVSRADQQSTAASLSGAQGRMDGVVAVPMFERLNSALRRGIEAGSIPLNRNGAVGWRVGNDLWLVSKRIADMLRDLMREEGQKGIPSKNSRIFDELQRRSVLVPNTEGMAVWQITVAGDDWSHDLSLIRADINRIWSGDQPQPAEFSGTILMNDGSVPPAPAAVAEAVGTAAVPTAAAPVAEPPQSSPQKVAEPLADSSTSSSSTVPSPPPPLAPAARPAADERDTAPPDAGSNASALALFDSLMGGDEPSKPAGKERNAAPDAAPAPPVPAPSPTPAPDPVLSPAPLPTASETATTPPAAEAKPVPTAGNEDGLGVQFLKWVQAGASNGSIHVNGPNAKVHRVREGVLLVSPAIFRSGASFLDVDWSTMQKKFFRLKINQKHNGINILTYAVEGGNQIKGVLIEDPHVIFQDDVPEPNPLLTQLV